MINLTQFNAVESFLKEAVEEGVFPGCNFGIITPDEKKFCSVGYRQTALNKVENSLDTIYDMASCTKVIVTTSCILKLMESGRLTLDTKVCEIIPELCQKELTIRSLLNHTSGYPSDVAGYKSMTREEMIETIYKTELETPTGQRVHYSDINFILLGFVIQRLGGSLDEFARKNLFEPLEMTSSCFNPDASLKSLCAPTEIIENRGGLIQGIVHDGKGFKLGGVSGHAGLFTTLEDVSHFVEMMLNDGVYHGKRVFSKHSVALLKKRTTIGLNENRSLGWVGSDPNYTQGDMHSDSIIYHTGFSGPTILIDFENKAGFVLLCNRVHPTRDNRKILSKRSYLFNIAYTCIE